MNKSSSKNLKRKEQSSTITPNSCKICGDIASYSYYGVIACESCKMFFKRNAEQKQKTLKCVSEGHCEIDMYTRHICTYCRLVKCFNRGMQIELIRCSSSKRNKTHLNKQCGSNEEQNTSTVLLALNDAKQLPSLNLLQADASILSIDQWTLISNFIHFFDENNRLRLGEDYIRRQNSLPSKLRFKPTTLIQYFQRSSISSYLFYQNNPDFLSLSAHDRTILVHITMPYTTSLCSSFICHQIGLYNQSAFYTGIELLYHRDIVSIAERIHNRLKFDTMTMTLFLAILTFSPISYIYYSNTPSVSLSNIQQILHIQNKYIELTWKYLLYRYNFEYAVMCFSNLILCLFAIHDALMIEQDYQWFSGTMNSMIQQTQKTLNLDH